MANRSSNKKTKEKKKLLKQGYKECTACDELVEPGAFKCTHCGKLAPAGKKMLVIAIVIIVIFSSAGLFYFVSDGHGAFSGTAPQIIQTSPLGDDIGLDESITVTFDMDMNRTSVESAFSISPVTPGTFSWNGPTVTFNPNTGLFYGTRYTVSIFSSASDLYGNSLNNDYSWQFETEKQPVIRRDIGKGDDDFWSVYPDQHISTGTIVDHPSWVELSANSKVVLILTHSEGCAPCISQTAICESIYSTYSPNIAYYDLLSGTDEPDATETFVAYDPTGETNYIPLTTLLTMGPNGQIIWHSWEGLVEEPILTSWVENAISYHTDY